MANILPVATVCEALADIQQNTDFCLNPDDVEDPYICRAVRGDGNRCRNLKLRPSEKWENDDLWFYFETITECPEINIFYNRVERFILLTHCAEHRKHSVDTFTKWKAERRTASNLLPVASPTNAISKKKYNSAMDTWRSRQKEEVKLTFASIVDSYPYSTVKISDGNNDKASGSFLNRPQGTRRMISNLSTNPIKDAAERAILYQKRMSSLNREDYQDDRVSNELNMNNLRITHDRLHVPDFLPRRISDSAFVGQEDSAFSDDNALFLDDMNNPHPVEEYFSVPEEELGESMQRTHAKQPASTIVDQDTSETATECSDESISTHMKKRHFIWELAKELFKTISPLEVDKRTLTRVFNILPELLKTFALRIGFRATTQMHRDIMAHVYRYRE
jgi:hypothetical protein